MFTAAQIRQQFLDFFREKKHTLVPSSSLLPDSPNLLFTNAGMNQFVPIFLGEKSADVSKWGGAIPGSDTRAADTQKCIRAGGKHNDLDDVGLDTYHHTFFEMLGNWSFGDYFKKEAIEWAWELVVERWGFPAQRVYATIYQPDKSLGDPAERDGEAWELWAEKFRAAGLDPAIHIVNGNKKDNFWMMGETGPCGPCSELHIDLTPAGDTRGLLVNQGTAECIEIWNLVFIQFNANPDGTFTPLPAQHVDTGMGFERVTSIIQGTKNFTDFANAKISNYETDIFRPIFDELEKMCGKRYGSTLPSLAASSEQPAASLPSLAASSEQPAASLPSLASSLPGLTPSHPSLASEGGEPREQKGEHREPRGELREQKGEARERGGEAREREGEAREQKGEAREQRGAVLQQGGEPLGSVGAAQKSPEPGQIAIDVAFRVIADHIRTLSFAIADGIQPGNTDRNYVLRRILRRASMFGRSLGFNKPFLSKLVGVIAHTMGDVFPEIRVKQKRVEDTISFEEDMFDITLDTGLSLFVDLVNAHYVYPKTAAAMEEPLAQLQSTWNSWQAGENVEASREACVKAAEAVSDEGSVVSQWAIDVLPKEFRDLRNVSMAIADRLDHNDPVVGMGIGMLEQAISIFASHKNRFTGEAAFLLSATYGFPIEETQRLAREKGLTVDMNRYAVLMEEHRALSRRAQKKQVIELSEIETKEPTQFVGYDSLETAATVLEVVTLKDRTAVVLEATACYAEMGGQVGDTGEIAGGGQLWNVLNTQKSGATFLHFIESVMGEDAPAVGSSVTLSVDAARRAAIQRHHTVTHLLHWALHEVVSREATQKGSAVGPDKLTFDFNSAALTPQQVRDVERLVNARIVENAGVSWTEVPYAEVRGRAEVMQFFGDKYGEIVRLVDIGGFSKELCAGTHTRATGEIGLFRIESEAAIAAGVRRIEAVAGLNAYDLSTQDMQRLHALAVKMGTPLPELEKRIEGMLAQQKELEKALKSAQQREAAGRARELLSKTENVNGVPCIIANLGAADGDTLQTVADALKGHGFKGVIVLGGFGVPPLGGPAKAGTPSVALVACVTPEYTAKVQAGKIIQTIAPLVGGKGGGKPDNARGGGKDPAQLEAALAHARTLLG